jgi:hypothetical protein
MNEETKQAMEDGYDMIVQLMEHIKDYSTNPESQEVLNQARGVLDTINDEIYKTL